MAEGKPNVKVHSAERHEDGDDYVVTYTIINYEEHAVTVDISDHPWTKTGDNPMLKIDDKDVRRKSGVTIPAARPGAGNTGTTTVEFRYPKSLGKPVQGYTDLWRPGSRQIPDTELHGSHPEITERKREQSFGRPLLDHGTGPFGEHLDGATWRLDWICLGGSAASDEFLCTFVTPYPWRLYSIYGPQELTFVLRRVLGVPPGWSADLLYPGANVPFRVPPLDRSRMGVLRLTIPPEIPAELEFELQIVQGVLGMPDLLPYNLITHLRFYVLPRRFDPLRTNVGHQSVQIGVSIVEGLREPLKAGYPALPPVPPVDGPITRPALGHFPRGGRQE